MSNPFCQQCSRALDRTVIYHCLNCGGFTIGPETDRCQCGREFYPIAFLAIHGKPFWLDKTRESRLTPHRPDEDLSPLPADETAGTSTGEKCEDRTSAGPHQDHIQTPVNSAGGTDGTFNPPGSHIPSDVAWHGPVHVPDPEPAEPVSDDWTTADNMSTADVLRLIADLRAAREDQKYLNGVYLKDADSFRDQIATLTQELMEERDKRASCPSCGAWYDSRRIGCGYCEAERVQEVVNTLTRERDEARAATDRCRELYDEAIRECDGIEEAYKTQCLHSAAWEDAANHNKQEAHKAQTELKVETIAHNAAMTLLQDTYESRIAELNAECERLRGELDRYDPKFATRWHANAAELTKQLAEKEIERDDLWQQVERLTNKLAEKEAECERLQHDSEQYEAIEEDRDFYVAEYEKTKAKLATAREALDEIRQPADENFLGRLELQELAKRALADIDGEKK